jgi:hypothetical protein
MMVKMMSLVGALALTFAAGAQAETTSVATLSQVTGKVMVNKGKGFVAAKSGMALADNDRLITLDGSSAAVVYGDGCTSQVKANSVLAINKALGCKSEVMAVQGQSLASPIRYAAVGDPPPLTPIVTTPLISGPTIMGTIIAGSFILTNTVTDDDGISGQ